MVYKILLDLGLSTEIITQRMSSQHALVWVYLRTGQRNVTGAGLLNGVIYFVEWPYLMRWV